MPLVYRVAAHWASSPLLCCLDNKYPLTYTGDTRWPGDSKQANRRRGMAVDVRADAVPADEFLEELEGLRKRRLSGELYRPPSLHPTKEHVAAAQLPQLVATASR